MSITNFIHKIKSKTHIDKTTILFLFIIIGVGIGSFALGRLSIKSSNSNINTKITASGIYSENTLINQSIEKNDVLSEEIYREKKYVASKNGKMYYPLGCNSAKRIKPENEVWFSSELDAEKSGYIKSSMCK